jgi:Protein phosphatase 2C
VIGYEGWIEVRRGIRDDRRQPMVTTALEDDADLPSPWSSVLAKEVRLSDLTKEWWKMRQVSSLAISDSGSDAGGSYNDDCWGSVSTAVWILDGATGLSKERLFPSAPSDAQWFVSAVDSELRNADWSKGTTPLLQSVMQRVHHRFHREAVGRIEQVSLWPLASFALTRVCEGRVEFANLGDCRILWRPPDGRAVKSFGSSRVTELDANVVKEIERLHRQGYTSHELVRRAVVPMIEANRKLKNTPEGYWILDVSGEGVAHLQTTIADAADVETILLCTDGYYRLVDTYHRWTDQSLLSDSVHNGVSAMIRELREIERLDEQCLKFPRMKPSDDATGILAFAKSD